MVLRSLCLRGSFLAVLAAATGPALAAPPVAEAGDDQVIDCAAPTGAEVTLDGTGSSDPDADPLTYSWADAALTVLSTDAMPTLTLPPGVNVLTLTVDDGLGGADTDTVTITVNADETPPVLVLSDESDELWPPNHKRQLYRAGDLVESVSDECSALSKDDVVFARGTSDEPDEGTGDGNFPDDVSFGEDCGGAGVRAERAGPGDGRVYQLFLHVEDAAGNEAEAPFTIVVPHDRAHGAVDSGVDHEVVSTCGEGEGCAPAPDPACADAGAADVRLTSGKKGPKLRWRASGLAPGSVSDEGNRLCVYTNGAPVGGSRHPDKVKMKGKKGQGSLSVATKGRGLELPALPLAPGAALRLELHDGTGQCVASSFDAPGVNEAGRYDAATD